MEVLRERLLNLTKNSSSSISGDKPGVDLDKPGVPCYVIPNNNNKYFLFITESFKMASFNGRQKEKEKALCLYFCNKDYHEFCIEIEYQSGLEEYLDIVFDGFLYEQFGKMTYQIYDILYMKSKTVEFTSKYMLLINLLYKSNQIVYKDLNTILTLEIVQPFYLSEDYQLYTKCNKFGKFFTHYLFYSENVLSNVKIEKEEIKRSLLIVKGQKTEIYNVHNPQTNDNLGVLYIPTLEKSKEIKELFLKNGNDEIEMECLFNFKFNKWTPV
jgi:hypothetical protein